MQARPARLGFVCTFDTFQLRFVVALLALVVVVAATATLQLVALSIRQLS